VRSSVRVLAALAVGIAFVVAGCGDDEEPATETGAAEASTEAGTPVTTEESGAPLGREEFIAKADGICRLYSRQLEQAAEQAFRGQTSLEEIERYIAEVFAPATRQELQAIRGLTPPEGDEEQVDAILDAAEGAVGAVEEDPALFETGSPFSEANRLASEYGLKVCGQ
jgi:hypothetical protein